MKQLNNYKGKLKMKRQKAARVLCIAIILALISCIGAYVLQTDFGRVDVSEIKISCDDGKWISGTLYRPLTATSETPAPMVIACHGYLNNSEMLDGISIELARRGISVISMDAYFHGDSSGTDTDVISSCMADGTGMIPMVEYAYNCLDYVDKTKIGVFGHSMGGMNVWMTCINYGTQYHEALAAAMDPASDGGEGVTEAEMAAAESLSKVSAGLASGFIALSNEHMCSALDCNFGINYSYYDEGNAVSGDMSGDREESLALINSIFKDDDKISNVNTGKYYGSADDGTLRVVYNPKITHETQHFSKTAIAQDIDFFTKSFGINDALGSGNQIWLLKEIFNAVGLIACLIAIVPIGTLLLGTKAFESLRCEVPEALPSPRTGKSKAIFWGGWVLSWLISWLTFMPLTTLDTKLFPATASMHTTNFFHQQTQNNLLIWAVFNGIIGIILFIISYKFNGKKNGVTTEQLGIKTNIGEFVKTIALACCIFIGFYAFVFAARYFFDTDYRFYTVAICGFTPDKLLVALQYIPFFFIFFAANAILTNSVNRISGQNEKLNVFLCGLGNCLGILMVNIVQYVKLFSTGVAMYVDARLYPMAAIPLILFLFVASYINRGLFKATGKVWLGALVNTFIIVMISAANTATLLAFL